MFDEKITVSIFGKPVKKLSMYKKYKNQIFEKDDDGDYINDIVDEIKEAIHDCSKTDDEEHNKCCKKLKKLLKKELKELKEGKKARIEIFKNAKVICQNGVDWSNFYGGPTIKD